MRVVVVVVGVERCESCVDAAEQIFAQLDLFCLFLLAEQICKQQKRQNWKQKRQQQQQHSDAHTHKTLIMNSNWTIKIFHVFYSHSQLIMSCDGERDVA